MAGTAHPTEALIVTSEERTKRLQDLLAKKDSGGLKTKDRLAIPAQEMLEQDATARRRNVSEVALGYIRGARFWKNNHRTKIKRTL